VSWSARRSRSRSRARPSASPEPLSRWREPSTIEPPSGCWTAARCRLDIFRRAGQRLAPPWRAAAAGVGLSPSPKNRLPPNSGTPASARQTRRAELSASRLPRAARPGRVSPALASAARRDNGGCAALKSCRELRAIQRLTRNSARYAQFSALRAIQRATRNSARYAHLDSPFSGPLASPKGVRVPSPAPTRESLPCVTAPRTGDTQRCRRARPRPCALINPTSR
jgi:hypothetical protein